jgi:hypothetical protein
MATHSNDSPKAAPGGAPAAAGGGYDRLAIPRPNGDLEYLTRAEFETLPLGDRVRLLMGGTLKFFRDGQEVPARQALRGA